MESSEREPTEVFNERETDEHAIDSFNLAQSLNGSAAFGDITARALAEKSASDGEEFSTADPLLERAEAVAAQLSGTDVGREMLAQILAGSVDRVADVLERFLATLESYAEGIDMITTEEGTEYRLVTLESLTGWRRRQAWKLLLSIGDKARQGLLNGLDMATIAAEIAGGENGIELLGIAYGPVGVSYDKTKVIKYGAAVDEMLTTKQITGCVLRFFSLSASSIVIFSRNCMEDLVNQVLGALPTTSPASSVTGEGE
jgi:hypothetical protein